MNTKTTSVQKVKSFQTKLFEKTKIDFNQESRQAKVYCEDDLHYQQWECSARMQKLCSLCAAKGMSEVVFYIKDNLHITVPVKVFLETHKLDCIAR